MTDHYIFDANFFISVHQVHPEPIVEAISQTVRDRSGVSHVTHLILGEVSSLRYKNRKHVVDDISKGFKIDHVDVKEIEALEAKVGGKEVSPQHPDLSLMVLGDNLGRTATTILVSDDFKIHTTQIKQNLRFKVVSPSAFMLDLSNNERDPHFRKTFRRIYRKVRRKEMEYMLSRRDTYNVEPKLSWLVDNLLGSTSGSRMATKKRIVPVSDKIEIDMAPLYRYINGERVRSSKLTPFENIIEYVDFLKESKGVDEEVRIHIEYGEFKCAWQVIRTGSSRLRRTLQEASLKVDPMDGLKLRQIFAHYLAHYHFLMAFVSLSLGKLLMAEESLDSAGFCALITRDNSDIVKASYIKALIYFSMEDNMEAREQFATTLNISQVLGLQEMEFKATFGLSITSFLTGRKDKAEQAMEKVHEMVEEFGREATFVLLEFADELHNFGRAEVALSIYNESLETALEWGQTAELEKIEDAMKQCHAELTNVGVALDAQLSHLIDKANDLAKECQAAYFAEIQELVREEAEQLKPLEIVVDKWTLGKDLPDVYSDWMEVVKFVPLKEPSEAMGQGHTLVLGYIEDVGTMGIYLTGERDHKRIERYQVRLKGSGSFKVLNAPQHYKRRYGLRGIIGSKDKDHVELKHIMFVPLSEQDD